MSRENWLNDAAKLLREKYFEPNGLVIPPKLLVSCGWPKGGKRAIGQCWAPEGSKDGETSHVFISPELEDSLRVIDVLLHELVHAAIGCKLGHGKEFKRIIRLFGLKGPATATFAEEGTELHQSLTELCASLGKYPHTQLKKVRGLKGSGASGWVRLRSPEQNGYTVVANPRQLLAHGYPLDPWGNKMEEMS